MDCLTSTNRLGHIQYVPHLQTGMVVVKSLTVIICISQILAPYLPLFTNSLPCSPCSLRKGITGRCIRRDSRIFNRADKNAFCLPVGERSDLLWLERRERAEIRQRLRGEPSLPILPLEEALSTTAPALLLIPAKDHGDKPRSRTSNRPSKLQSLFAATRHLPPLIMLRFAYAGSWPRLTPTSTNSTLRLQCRPSSRCECGPWGTGSHGLGAQELLLSLWSKPLSLTGLNANFIWEGL